MSPVPLWRMSEAVVWRSECGENDARPSSSVRPSRTRGGTPAARRRDRHASRPWTGRRAEAGLSNRGGAFPRAAGAPGLVAHGRLRSSGLPIGLGRTLGYRRGRRRPRGPSRQIRGRCSRSRSRSSRAYTSPGRSPVSTWTVQSGAHQGATFPGRCEEGVALFPVHRLLLHGGLPGLGLCRELQFLMARQCD